MGEDMTYTEDVQVSQDAAEVLDEELIEAVPTAADALEEEPERLDPPPADDKDAQIRYLTEQLESTKKVEKATRLRSEAETAAKNAPERYPYADQEILAEALKKGKNANEINYLAKTTHFAVAKIANKAAETAVKQKEAEVTQSWGTPAGGGTAPTGELSARELAKLPREEIIRNAGKVKRSDRTSF